MAKLGDICKFQSGGTPSKSNPDFFGGNIPWITTVALNGGTIGNEDAVEWITDIAIQKSAAKVVPQNSVLVGTRVGIGKVAINSVPMSTSQDVIAMLDIDTAIWNKNFLCKFIQSKNDFLLSQARGATIKGIKIETLSNMQVPDIPINEQCRIATVMDKVGALIAKRQAQLDKLDLLVKARFVEITECASQSVTAEEACSNIVDCPHSTPKYTGEQKKYPAIRTSEIRNGQIDWSTMLYVAHEEYQQRVKRLVPMPGDIVYAREGVYGDCVILPREYEFCLGQRTMLFRPNYKICTSEYLHQALRSDSVKRQADQSNAGSTVPHVNVTDAKKFEFPLPAIEMQKEFSNFMERVWRVKNSIDRSLEKLETLKKALVQEYFG